jgi:hypothetical protein
MISWQERDFEDWLCSDDENGYWKIRELVQNIAPIGKRPSFARQIDIGIGRIDVLAWSEDGVVVFELKCSQADGNDLAQVMEYAEWVRARLSILTIGQPDPPRGFVCPFLVAPSFTDRVRSAAAWANVTLVEAAVLWSLDLDCENRAEDDAYDSDTKTVDAWLLEAVANAVEVYVPHEIAHPEVPRDGEAQESGRRFLDEPENETLSVALPDATGGLDNEDC